MEGLVLCRWCKKTRRPNEVCSCEVGTAMAELGWKTEENMRLRSEVAWLREVLEGREALVQAAARLAQANPNLTPESALDLLRKVAQRPNLNS